MLELLEDRCIPAAFGIPWTDATHLTLSFAPDGTGIAGHQSTLFQTLDQQLPTAVWQNIFARALQTWVGYANISVGIVADGGQAFGTPGQMQGDSRFGDIRIGAQSMAPDSLAYAVPHDPFLSGTWSGDVLINSNTVFDGKKADLYSVMLHEFGHTLGFDENEDPTSVMYSHFNGIRTGLGAIDITAVQALYGVRSPDLNEGSNGNDSINRATQISLSQISGGFTGATPLVMFGDVTTTKDADFYQIRPLSGYTGEMTFRVVTGGISLLEPRLTILDSKGHVLGQSLSTNPLGDTITVELSNVDPQLNYYIKVDGATSDLNGIGRYGLGVTFDDTLTTSIATLDSVLRGPFEKLQPKEVDAVFSSSGTTFFNDDAGTNDTLGTATALQTTAGFVSNTHYEVVGSLTKGDLDYYRLKAAQYSNGVANVLTVTLRSLDPNGAAPHVSVLDSKGNVVPSTILLNGNGTFVLQTSSFKSGDNLYLLVPASPAFAVVGNYSLIADFGHVEAKLTTFANGTVGDSSPAAANLYIADNQLFQFVLSASAANAPADARVHMTITDANGTVVFDLFANAGDTASGPAILLVPGAYSVRITAESASGSPISGLNYQVRGAILGGPIGPVLDDPTLLGQYHNPNGTFTYPGGLVSLNPYYWLAILL